MAKSKRKISSRESNPKKGKSKPIPFSAVKNILHQTQSTAYNAVNSFMVVAYWHIGKLIIEEEQGKLKAEYGKAILQDLSDKLNKEFKSGYSVQNLRNFRQFYLTFPEIRSTVWSESTEAQILSTLWRELLWSQYKLIMRVENPDARAYYMTEAVEQNWGVRGFERQINSFYYERILSSKNKKA